MQLFKLTNGREVISKNVLLIFVAAKTQNIYNLRTMAGAKSIPLVDIDPSGVFKYILLNVYDKQKDPAKPQMVILRGYKRCNYHSDIYDEVRSLFYDS